MQRGLIVLRGWNSQLLMPYLNFHFGSLRAGAAQTPACLFHCCLHLHNTGAAARSCVGVKICFVCEALATVGANVVWQSDGETFGMGLIPCSFFTLWLSPDLCRTFPLSCWELSSHPGRAFSPFSTLHLCKTQGCLLWGCTATNSASSLQL